MHCMNKKKIVSNEIFFFPQAFTQKTEDSSFSSSSSQASHLLAFACSLTSRFSLLPVLLLLQPLLNILVSFTSSYSSLSFPFSSIFLGRCYRLPLLHPLPSFYIPFILLRLWVGVTANKPGVR